jgi:hypothetical protein
LKQNMVLSESSSAGPNNPLRQLLMQNQALLSAVSNHHQQQQPMSRAALGGSVAPGSQSIGFDTGRLSMTGQERQQHANPFYSMSNQQQALQNQIAAYQSGLMGLPPQLLQQQQPNMQLPGMMFASSVSAMMPNFQGFGASSMSPLASSATAAASAQQHGSGSATLSPAEAAQLSGRKPQTLYMTCDDDSLSEYQCLVRKQIEIFEARPDDVESNAKGRNKPIILGQVGIRCRHCQFLAPKSRQRGATYYPAKLNGLYQAAQSMASGHLCYHCNHIPQDLRNELLVLRERKSSAGGGKKYWGDGVRILGVYEDDNGLRFQREGG